MGGRVARLLKREEIIYRHGSTLHSAPHRSAPMAMLQRTRIENYLNHLRRTSAQAGTAFRDEYLYDLDTLRTNPHHVRGMNIIVSKCCGGHLSIGYINHLIQGLAARWCEMVVCLDRPTDLIGDDTLANYVRGVMVVQVGECRDRPDMPCIALVCSPHGKGNLLLGLFVHALSQAHEMDGGGTLGALEVAAGTLNLGGLCLYSKYGFEFDPSLTGPNCFRDARNLPMTVDLTRFGQTRAEQTDKVANIVCGLDPGFVRPKVCAMRGKSQALYAALSEVDRLQTYLPDDEVPAMLETRDGHLVDVMWLQQTFPDPAGLTKLLQTFDTITARQLDWLLDKCIIPIPPKQTQPPLPPPPQPQPQPRSQQQQQTQPPPPPKPVAPLGPPPGLPPATQPAPQPATQPASQAPPPQPQPADQWDTIPLDDTSRPQTPVLHQTQPLVQLPQPAAPLVAVPTARRAITKGGSSSADKDEWLFWRRDGLPHGRRYSRHRRARRSPSRKHSARRRRR